MTVGRIDRWQRWTLSVLTGVLLVTASTFAYLRQGAMVMTVDDAVSDFRAAGASPQVSAGAKAETAAAPAADAEGAGRVVAAANANGTAAASTAPAGASRSSAPIASNGQINAAAAPSQAAAAAAGAPARRIAAEGVYVYDTDGYEETDAVGGARHDYPEQTAVTVRWNDCGGFVMRWQPLDERWDRSDLCADDGGVAIRLFSTFHEFFQQRQQNDFPCAPGTHVFRWGATTGTAWNWECTDGKSVFATTVTYVELVELTVGGHSFRAAHMRYESKMTGANRGIQTQDRWIDPETGLVYKMRTDIDTEADSPFGAVNYQEHYTITLTSATPRT